MGFFGRLLGIETESDRRPARATAAAGSGVATPDNDAQAIERYRYMLRTAPPETLEEAYAEGFAKLTPEQRQKVLSELTNAAPANERATLSATSPEDPRALARAATRAEIRQPGVMERSLGSGGMGFGANLLSSFAMGFVGSMVAQSFFSAMGGFGDEASAEDADPSAAGDGQLAENASDDDGGDDSSDDGGDFGGDFDV